MINTKKVAGRRQLHFASFADAIADAEMLRDAESAGTLRQLGNWRLGQAVGHVAYWACAPFDGYPPMSPPPWLMRVMLRLFKRRILTHALPAGFSIPGAPGGTFGIEIVETDDALARLGHAFDRLASTCPKSPNPAFGPLSHEEWILLNLRHAELHLSFFQPS